MSHVDYEQSADFIRDFTKSSIVDYARISAGAGDNQLRSLLLCQSLESVIVDSFGLLGNTVRYDTVKHPREIHRAAHRQMTAVSKVHPQIAIARLEDSEIDSHVRLGSRMGLNIGVIGAEQFFGPRNRQGFDFIDELTATVIALSRIPFGIFISHDATLRLQDCFTDNVFRSNELKVLFKSSGFFLNRRENFGIGLF